MRRLPILFSGAQLAHNVADFHRRARRFNAAIDSFLKTTLAGLIFIFHFEDDVDHRHAVFDRDVLQRIGYGIAEMFRM